LAGAVKNPPFPAVIASRPAPRARTLFAEPFRITNSELPDNVLLMAKVLTLAFLATGQIRLLSWHFLPFMRFFDRVGTPAQFHWTLVGIFLAAAAALFYNRQVRLCCLVLGGVILVSLLSSREYFENNRTYCACILLLAGLSSRGQKPWALRAQVVLLYFGAALNKIMQPDWRSGQFFWYWFGQIHHPDLWRRVTAFVPEMPLAQFFCWSTIIIEFVLVIGFLTPRWYTRSIWLGAAYHTALLVMMNSTFGMFYYAMLASYLAFVDWPAAPLLVFYPDGSRLGWFLQRLDIPRAFEWRPLAPTGGDTAWAPGLPDDLTLSENGVVYAGFAALKRILFLSPAAYFAMVILLGRQPRAFPYHRWLAAAVVVLFTPFLSAFGQTIYRRLTRLPRRAVKTPKSQAA
jgi:hypothetical protein